jgi:predicted RNA methylase
MPCECGAVGLDEMFGEKRAQRDAKRYRSHGIEKRSLRLIDAIAQDTPIAGATVLEGGSGVGGLSLTLLQRGARRAFIVDASPAAMATARVLAEERGVADRLEPIVGDFALIDPLPADVVVLDRVVCCYPDWASLLRAARTAAQRTIGLVYPRDAWYSYAGVAAINAAQALLRRQFRVHVHPVERMLGSLKDAGFLPRVVGHAGIWEIAVATRG